MGSRRLILSTMAITGQIRIALKFRAVFKTAQTIQSIHKWRRCHLSNKVTRVKDTSYPLENKMEQSILQSRQRVKSKYFLFFAIFRNVTVHNITAGT
jgi:hypothetical protein